MASLVFSSSSFSISRARSSRRRIASSARISVRCNMYDFLSFGNGVPLQSQPQPCIPVLNDPTMAELFPGPRRLQGGVGVQDSKLRIFSGTANPELEDSRLQIFSGTANPELAKVSVISTNMLQA